MRRRSLLALPALGAFLCAAPAVGRAAVAGKLRVVASMTVLGDMARQVAGDHAAVTTLVGPDGDAHAYEPTPADAKALADADLVIVNGLGLEGWIDRLIKASGYKGAVVIASQGVVARRMDEGGKPIPDPHAWQSLTNGRLYAENIGKALADADPSHAAGYRAATASFVARIDAMDEYVRQEIAKIPQEQRKVVTSHDAFGYFGQAYGVTFLAAEGISEDAQPSAAGVRRLIDQIRSQRVKVYFLENALSPRLVAQIAKESGARLGGTLYADALSKPGGPADTYLGMFTHNAPLLRDAMLATGGEG